MRECQKRASQKWDSANKVKIKVYKRNYYRRKIMKQQFENIISIVCNEFNVSAEDIKGDFKPKNVISARQLYCYLATYTTKASSTNIGGFINRSHSTVLHSVKTVENQIDVYPGFASMVKSKMDQVKNKVPQTQTSTVDIQKCISIPTF